MVTVPTVAVVASVAVVTVRHSLTSVGSTLIVGAAESQGGTTVARAEPEGCSGLELLACEANGCDPAESLAVAL